MEIECQIKPAISWFVFQYSNTDLILKLSNSLFTKLEQPDSEWSCTEAAWTYLYSKKVWEYEADQVMIEKLTILDDIESYDIASFFIVTTVDGDKDVLFLFFKFVIQGLDLA